MGRCTDQQDHSNFICGRYQQHAAAKLALRAALTVVWRLLLMNEQLRITLRTLAERRHLRVMTKVSR
jgi:hypothetical protein